MIHVNGGGKNIIKIKIILKGGMHMISVDATGNK
jgi:hypothetical protein